MTRVYFLQISSVSSERALELYEKIGTHFLSDGKISMRKESLLGRILLHRALENMGVNDYTVFYKGNEKPELQCPEELYFNISHSGDSVVLALSDKQVGCDIQEIRAYNPRVAERNYCEKEIRLIEDSESRDDTFIRFWALKESILKFTGQGLSGGLSGYDFSPYSASESFSSFSCNFYVRKTGNMYFALCHKNTEYEIINFQV